MTARTRAGLLARLGGLLERRKYELLLAAILQHLLTPAFLLDLDAYTRWAWPVNMVLLGLFSVGVFAGQPGRSRGLRDALAVAVVAFPVLWTVITPTRGVMIALSLCYVAFFLAIFVQVLRHMIRPSYIDADLVSAAVCGVLLLLETSTFLMQALHYAVPGSFRGVDTSSPTATYLDLVYFCAIVVTSIGFGDITPAHHVSKLATAAVGLTGQTYSVVLVGILISKYTAGRASRREEAQRSQR